MSAVIAALIAGLVAYIGLILNKENEVSKFRQSWIDSFRNEVSTLVQLLSEIRDLRSNKISTDGYEEYDLNEYQKQSIDKFNKATSEITRMKNSLLLRINHDKNRQTDAEKLLKETLTAINTDDYYSLDKLNDINSKIMFNSGGILKSEWNRVKKGEDSYNIFIGIIFWILSVFFTLSWIYFVFHFDKFWIFMTS